jgi:hypothetical protein
MVLSPETLKQIKEFGVKKTRVVRTRKKTMFGFINPTYTTKRYNKTDKALEKEVKRLIKKLHGRAKELGVPVSYTNASGKKVFRTKAAINNGIYQKLF